jgi:hypothetical protein
MDGTMCKQNDSVIINSSLADELSQIAALLETQNNVINLHLFETNEHQKAIFAQLIEKQTRK